MPDVAKKSPPSSPKSGGSPPSSPSKKALARSGTGTKSLGLKKKPAGPADELAFVNGITATSTSKEVQRLLALLTGAASAGQADLVEAASEAVERMAANEKGFKILLKNGCIQSVLTILSEANEGEDAENEHLIPVYEAQEALCQAACTWCDNLDPVDFPEIPNLVYICTWLSGGDEDVAVSAMAALDAFIMHKRENAATLLQAGILNIIHTIIGTHREPELIQETFALLFRLCDLPAETILEPLLAEREIVLSVVESMEHAPLNVKLQISGIRLLCLWSRLGDKKLQKALDDADAKAAVKRARGHLEKSGFVHAAAWLSVMGQPLVA